MIRAVASSDKLVINVTEPKKVIPTPSVTQTPENVIVIPGFSGVSGMVAIMLVVYIIMRGKKVVKIINKRDDKNV